MNSYKSNPLAIGRNRGRSGNPRHQLSWCAPEGRDLVEISSIVGNQHANEVDVVPIGRENHARTLIIAQVNKLDVIVCSQLLQPDGSLSAVTIQCVPVVDRKFSIGRDSQIVTNIAGGREA